MDVNLSLSFRERLRHAEKRLREKLKLSQEDWDIIQENIREYCKYSDELMREMYGNYINVDEKADKIPENEFDEIAKIIIKMILEDIKGKKKKETKKKKKTESEEQSDSDSDADSDTKEQTEQVVEAECK